MSAAIHQIFIRELRVPASVGIYDWELLAKQTLEFDIDIGVTGERAGQSDDIHDTIHYGRVIERIQTELAARHFKLLETLAGELARILTDDFGAAWARVSVAKLGHLRGVKKVGVVVTRGLPASGTGVAC